MDPSYFEAYLNLGNAFRADGRVSNAAAHYQKAISVRPPSAEAHNNLAAIWQIEGDLPEAIAGYQRAIEFKPDYTDSHVNLGIALQIAGRNDEADAAYCRALKIEPGCVQAHNCRGFLAHLRGRATEAVAHFDQALSFSPQDTSARAFRGFVRLQLGEFGPGWDDLEARWQAGSNEVPRDYFDQPSWDGSSLVDRTILVHAEQGIGDEIMFASCFRELAAGAGSCIVTCDPRLQPLFSRSIPECEFHPTARSAEALRAVAAKTSPDVQIAAASVPRFLRRRVEDFGEGAAFLHTDPAKLARWRHRLSTLDGKLKIGISWRGGVPQKKLFQWRFGSPTVPAESQAGASLRSEMKEREQRNRSTRLEQWEPLLSFP